MIYASEVNTGWLDEFLSEKHVLPERRGNSGPPFTCLCHSEHPTTGLVFGDHTKACPVSNACLCLLQRPSKSLLQCPAHLCLKQNVRCTLSNRAIQYKTVKTLWWGSRAEVSKLFLEGPERKYFRFCKPFALLQPQHSAITVQRQPREEVTKWA